jgi:hypothetical protein
MVTLPFGLHCYQYLLALAVAASSLIESVIGKLIEKSAKVIQQEGILKNNYRCPCWNNFHSIFGVGVFNEHAAKISWELVARYFW